MRKLEMGGSTLFLLPTVKGLSSEVGRVEEGFDEVEPEMLALPLSDDALEDLRLLAGGDKEKLTVSHFEETYYKHLARFGEVRVPPPNFEAALVMAQERGLPVEAIDMSEEEYTDAYTSNVSTLSWLFEGKRFKKLAKRKFKASTPQEFAVEWDQAVNRLKGFRALERARERHMAGRLAELAKGGKRILAVLEYERYDGVLKLMEKKARD